MGNILCCLDNVTDGFVPQKSKKNKRESLYCLDCDNLEKDCTCDRKRHRGNFDKMPSNQGIIRN